MIWLCMWKYDGASLIFYWHCNKGYVHYSLYYRLCIWSNDLVLDMEVWWSWADILVTLWQRLIYKPIKFQPELRYGYVFFFCILQDTFRCYVKVYTWKHQYELVWVKTFHNAKSVLTYDLISEENEACCRVVVLALWPMLFFTISFSKQLTSQSHFHKPLDLTVFLVIVCHRWNTMNIYL